MPGHLLRVAALWSWHFYPHLLRLFSPSPQVASREPLPLAIGRRPDAPGSVGPSGTDGSWDASWVGRLREGGDQTAAQRRDWAAACLAEHSAAFEVGADRSSPRGSSCLIRPKGGLALGTISGFALMPCPDALPHLSLSPLPPLARSGGAFCRPPSTAAAVVGPRPTNSSTRPCPRPRPRGKQRRVATRSPAPGPAPVPAPVPVPARAAAAASRRRTRRRTRLRGGQCTCSGWPRRARWWRGHWGAPTWPPTSTPRRLSTRSPGGSSSPGATPSGPLTSLRSGPLPSSLGTRTLCVLL